MAYTFKDLIEEVFVHLEGYYNADNERIFRLSGSNINSNVETINILPETTNPDTSQILELGSIEIDDELMYVRSYTQTPSLGTFTVFRGYKGTTAAPHDAGTLVKVNPTVPRHWVKNAINDTLINIYPKVPVVKVHEFNYNPSVVAYPLPNDAVHVIGVQYLPPGPTKAWERSRRWSFDSTAGSNFTVEKTINVWEGYPGKPVQVLYYTEPTKMTNENNPYQGHTGLPEWTTNLVILGACYRVATFLDMKRLSIMSADQSFSNADQVSPPNQAQNLSKYFFALYQQALTDAEARIHDLYPATRHYIS